MRLKAMNYKTFINISNINELKEIRVIRNENSVVLRLGANLTLSDLITSLKQIKSSNMIKEHEKSALDALLSNLRWFASTQIRNFATLAGNIVTGSPISDLNPILMANNSTLTVCSAQNGLRSIPMRNFFLGYRRVDLQPDEILFHVDMPLPETQLEIVRAYKQAKRKQDDIAIVNACFRLKLANQNELHTIEELDVCYGGLAPVTLYLSSLSVHTKGLAWADLTVLEQIQNLILNEIDLGYSAPGGMPTYRRTLAVSFFKRFWYQVVRDLGLGQNIGDQQSLANLDEIEREPIRSKHDFGEISQSATNPIGTINPHLSGLKQTTGVAKYLDDIPEHPNELFAALVLSSKSHANIKKICLDKALALEGVHKFVSSRDIPSGLNIFNFE